MAYQVKHHFQSAKADGTDVTLIKPTNWNEPHEITTDSTVPVILGATAPGAYVELPISAIMPTGAVIAFAGAVAPAGWYLCDGSLKNRITDAVLFNALGGNSSPWGLGDGSTTFNLPDLRGRVVASPDGGAGRLTGWVPGTAGGAAYGQLQAHTHAGADHLHAMADHYHIGANGGQSVLYANVGNFQWGHINVGTGNLVAGVTGTAVGSMDMARNTGGADRALTTGNAGDNSGTNNVQPTLSMNHIIKA
jgi:microcystin-dependent protein